MSSLWRIAENRKKRTQLKENPFPILHRSENGFVRGARSTCYIKRTPLSYLLEGSMTVEATVVIPMLLFFFINLMSAFEMLRLHGNVALALWEKGRVMAVSGYVYDAVYGEEKEQSNVTDNNRLWEDILAKLGGTLLTDVMLRSNVISNLGREYLDESPLTNGAEGLNFLESAYLENECIDIKVTYQVSPVFAIPGFSSFRMANRYYARAWTGYRVDDTMPEREEPARVYITQYGDVYHMDRNCSYLVRTVKTLDISEVGNIRNNSGERYRRCEICGDNGQRIIHVTQEGNKYHGRRDCPSLIRTVISVEYKQAEEYRPCSKCAS